MPNPNRAPFASSFWHPLSLSPSLPLPLSPFSPRQTYTLDDKHNGEKLSNGRHCTANFADPRRMLKMMKKRWVRVYACMCPSVSSLSYTRTLTPHSLTPPPLQPLQGEDHEFDYVILDYFFR